MTTSDMIRELCDRMNISLAELCRRIGQTPQNFNNFADGLDRLRRILIRSCSVGLFLLRKWG